MFTNSLAECWNGWLPRPGEHILDIGCGDGQLTERIAANGAVVMGVDSSPEMVAATRESGLKAIEANAEALPFKDHTFDAVFSNAALHWVRNQDAMLSEVHRVLKPGGRFVAEMGGHGNVAAFVSPSLPFSQFTTSAIPSIGKITFPLPRNTSPASPTTASRCSRPLSYLVLLCSTKAAWRAGSAPSAAESSKIYRWNRAIRL